MPAPKPPTWQHPTPSKIKTDLERLLKSCDRLSQSGVHISERRKFETFLSTLTRLWQELQKQSEQREWLGGSVACCSEAQLGEYRRHIERLAELLDDGKLLSGAGSQLALTQALCNGNLTREQANAELSSRLHATSRMQQALRNQLLGPAASSSQQAVEPSPPDSTPGAGCAACAASSSSSSLEQPPRNAAAAATSSTASRESLFGASGGRLGGGADAAEAESLSRTLADQREMQEEALSDLSKMAAGLRDRTLKAQSAVRAHCSTLETTSAAVESNQTRLNAVNTKLRQQLRSMSSSTCYILLMLMMVTILFMFTYMLMKIAPKRR